MGVTIPLIRPNASADVDLRAAYDNPEDGRAALGAERRRFDCQLNLKTEMAMTVLVDKRVLRQNHTRSVLSKPCVPLSET